MFQRNRLLLTVALVGLILMSWSLPTSAGYYDGKTITLLIPVPGGSGLDVSARTFAQQWQKRITVAVQGYIEHRYMGIMDIGKLLQQAYITLDPCYEPGFRPWFSQPELVQSADTVRITVKDVDVFH